MYCGSCCTSLSFAPKEVPPVGPPPREAERPRPTAATRLPEAPAPNEVPPVGPPPREAERPPAPPMPTAKSAVSVAAPEVGGDVVLPQPSAAAPLPEPPAPEDAAQGSPGAEPHGEVPPVGPPPGPGEAERPPAPTATGTDFYVTIDKGDDGKLGLGTLYRHQPPALRVSKVKPGPVSEWNAANLDRQILVDSIILEVNGEKTDVNKMYALIASEQQLRLLVSNGP